MSGFQIYNNFPATSGTALDQLDFYTGDGVTTTFGLINKIGLRVGSSVLVGTSILYASNGDYTVSGNNIVFTSAPPLNAPIVVPGITNLMSGMLFDQSSVPGVSNANITTVPFWIGDTSTIDNYSYVASADNSGIVVSWNNFTPSNGAATSWVQFAANTTGNVPGTFGAAGASITTGPISASDSFTANTTTGATSIPVNDANNFNVLDWVLLSSGTSNAEVLQITAIPNSTTLTVTTTSYNHTDGDSVYTCLRQLWVQIIVPINFTSGTTSTFLNLSLEPQLLTQLRG